MSDCIFCKIVRHELPISEVYSDDLVTAFMDLQPVNAGHVLVVPNVHAEFLADLDDATAGRMFAVARRVAAAIRASGLRCEGVNLFLADGAAAMQEVPHCHLHVFPRYRGDGFGFQFGPHYAKQPRDVLDEAAGKIRMNL